MSEESGDDRSAVDGEDSASEPDAWGRVDDDPAEPGIAADETPAADDVDDQALDELEDEEDYEPSLAGVFGAQPEDAPPRPEIVPEPVDVENALFVLLGVLFGLFVIYRAVVVFTA